MARLISILPCEAFYQLELPQRVIGPAFIFGDEFGIPAAIDVAVAIAEAGQDDVVHVELRHLDGRPVTRSQSVLFSVPEHFVAHLLGFELELDALEAHGRYNLVCMVESQDVGGCDVFFREVQA